MRFLAAVAIMVAMSGCDSKMDEINKMERPVVVSAIGPNGVMLRGGDGKLCLVHTDTYVGGALTNAKVGDVLSPSPIFLGYSRPTRTSR